MHPARMRLPRLRQDQDNGRCGQIIHRLRRQLGSAARSASRERRGEPPPPAPCSGPRFPLCTHSATYPNKQHTAEQKTGQRRPQPHERQHTSSKAFWAPPTPPAAVGPSSGPAGRRRRAPEGPPSQQAAVGAASHRHTHCPCRGVGRSRRPPPPTLKLAGRGGAPARWRPGEAYGAAAAALGSVEAHYTSACAPLMAAAMKCGS